MRVELPDVPGSLGRVASAIGEAGGDIEAIEIVEKRDGFAVDDVLLEIAPGTMPDSIVSACSVLDGVSVLWINRYAAGGNLFLDLEVVEALTEDPVDRAGPARRPAADRLPRRLGRARPPRRRRARGRPRDRRRPDRVRHRPDHRADAAARRRDLRRVRGPLRRRRRADGPPRRSGVPRLRARPARAPARPGDHDQPPLRLHPSARRPAV